MAAIIVRSVELYLLVGILFALWFSWRGAARLDPVATESSLGFRWMIVPAAAALWPLLAFRLLRKHSG
jgi:hypothetical protein